MVSVARCDDESARITDWRQVSMPEAFQQRFSINAFVL
jgi:hypothetical protein